MPRPFKLFLPTLCSAFFMILLFSSNCLAEAYRIEVLVSNPDDVYTLKDSYLPQFPIGSGVKNKKGDVFTSYPLRLYTQKKLIPLDCVLSNATRWEVIDAFGMNDNSDLLVILQSRDRIDVWILAALRATAERPQSYCPVITWDIDKTCLKNVFENQVGIDGEDPRVRLDGNGLPHFPVTTDRNLYFESRGGLDFFLTPETVKTKRCNIRITARNAGGSAITNHRLLVFGAGDGRPEQILGAVRTNRRGQANVTIDYPTFVKKNWPGDCQGVTVRVQFPFNNKQLVTKGFRAYIWDHCE